MPPRYISVHSNDGFTFVIPREAAMVSGTWQRMLNSESYLESQTGEIAFDESAELISIVVDYLFYNLKYQQTEGQPDCEFNIPPDLALQLLVVADYLNV